MNLRLKTILWCVVLATGCEECSDWGLFNQDDPDLRPDPKDDPNYNKGDVENYPPQTENTAMVSTMMGMV